MLVADDDAEMREVLRTLLADHPDIEVVGDAADGRGAVERAMELAPDIVVMDIVMRGMGGIDATRLVRRARPSVRVLGLSLHDDRRFAAAMRAAGASGLLLKQRAYEDLAEALRVVASGGTWWPCDAGGPQREV